MNRGSQAQPPCVSPAGMNAAVRAVTRMGIYVGAKVFLIYEVRQAALVGAGWAGGVVLEGGDTGPIWKWSLVAVQPEAQTEGRVTRRQDSDGLGGSWAPALGCG